MDVMQSKSLVLIADAAQRAAMKAQVDRCPGLALAGEIGEIGALGLLAGLDSDVVVLDCAAPGFNSLIIVPWLRGLPAPPRIVALGASGSRAEQQFLLALGADHYTTLDGLAPVLLRVASAGPAADRPARHAA